MNPNLTAIVDQLAPHINACNAQKDLAVIKNIRRVSEGPSEQLLPDFYCEHTTLAMNRDRRKHVSYSKHQKYFTTLIKMLNFFGFFC